MISGGETVQVNCILSDISFFNLQCLCNETFKCCSKFFLQMYNIHGLCNGHFVRSNLTFEPTTVHIDFEVAMLTVL